MSQDYNQEKAGKPWEEGFDFAIENYSDFSSPDQTTSMFAEAALLQAKKSLEIKDETAFKFGASLAVSRLIIYDKI